MRYRPGEDPATSTTASSTEAALVLTLGLVIGIVPTWLGIRGEQRWLAIGSAGLIVASIATMVWLERS